MKTILFAIFLVSCLVTFGGSPFARPWTDFVGEDVVNPKDYDRITEYYQAKQEPFKKLLTLWESKDHQAKIIQSLTKNGIGKKLAKRAVEERIKMARKIIKSNFKGVEDISPSLDRLENRVHVTKFIAALGYERLQSLMKKYNIKVKSGFNNCLCKYYSIAGNSSGFSPARDKHCDNTDPCKGGNFGCSSHDFPKDPGRYAYCAKKYTTNKGLNIFQTLDEHLDTRKKLSFEDFSPKLSQRSKKYEEACLPSLSQKNLKNASDTFKSATAGQAIDISEKAENICEEAVAVNLFLNSKRGNTDDVVAMQLLTVWVWKNEYDMGEHGTKMLAEGMLKNVLGKAFSVASTLKNAYDTRELLNKETNNRRTDIYYKEAYDLFQKSKNWSGKKIIIQTKKTHQSIKTIREKIMNIEANLENQIDLVRTQSLIKAGGTRPGLAFKLNKNLQFEFNNKRNELIQKSKSTNMKLLHKLENLLLKESVLVNYRIPFSQNSCDKYLAIRESMCKKMKAVRARKKREKQEKAQRIVLEKAARKRDRLSVGEKNTLSGGIGGVVPGTEPKR
jgi:hypothetical protein